MDKISKAIRKLSRKQAKQVAEAIEQLLSQNTKGLDIKKLKGFQNIFRIRVGNHRVIFKKEGNDLLILEISNRDDNTYRKY